MEQKEKQIREIVKNLKERKNEITVYDILDAIKDVLPKYTEWLKEVMKERDQFYIPDDNIYEKHHIIPRCFGGFGDYKSNRFKKENTKNSNCIYLNPMDHYTGHKLIFEDMPNNSKAAFGWWNMCHVRSGDKSYREIIEVDADEYNELRRRYLKNCSGENASFYGKHLSEDQRKKLSESRKGCSNKLLTAIVKDKWAKYTPEERKEIMNQRGMNVKGRHFYNNGVNEILAFECPDGYVLGRLKNRNYATNEGKHYYNNGVNEIIASECPDGYVLGTLKKTKKHFYNDGVRVYKSETCPEGCVPGMIKKATKLKHYYTNGEDQIFSDICPDGWQMGKSESYKNRKWYNNGVEQKLLKECPEGWIEGRLNHISSYNTSWYNNGEIELRAKECPDGFVRGRLSLGNIWYTNGTEEVLSPECPDGWYKGRINQKKGFKFYNNGKVEIQTIEPPIGDEWIEGKLKGRRWFTDGINDYLDFKCPDGCVLGKSKSIKKYTDGEQIIYARECPDGYYTANKLEYAKNMCWYNNGEKEIYSYDCPDGYSIGRINYSNDANAGNHLRKENNAIKHWYNNGEQQGQYEKCPEGWVPGRLKNPSKGKHYYTNGIEQVFSETCPDGWWAGTIIAPVLKGSHFYTNGEEETRAYVCPEGWWLGRCDKVRAKQSASKYAYMKKQEAQKSLNEN